jgi:hypothetical protein
MGGRHQIGTVGEIIPEWWATSSGISTGPPYRSADKVKHEGWHEQNILVVSLDDQRLTWPERELIHQLGT